MATACAAPGQACGPAPNGNPASPIVTNTVSPAATATSPIRVSTVAIRRVRAVGGSATSVVATTSDARSPLWTTVAATELVISTAVAWYDWTSTPTSAAAW